MKNQLPSDAHLNVSDPELLPESLADFVRDVTALMLEQCPAEVLANPVQAHMLAEAELQGEYSAFNAALQMSANTHADPDQVVASVSDEASEPLEYTSTIRGGTDSSVVKEDVARQELEAKVRALVDGEILEGSLRIEWAATITYALLKERIGNEGISDIGQDERRDLLASVQAVLRQIQRERRLAARPQQAEELFVMRVRELRRSGLLEGVPNNMRSIWLAAEILKQQSGGNEPPIVEMEEWEEVMDNVKRALERIRRSPNANS